MQEVRQFARSWYSFPHVGRIVKEQEKSSITYINYKEVLERAQQIGSAIVL